MRLRDYRGEDLNQWRVLSNTYAHKFKSVGGRLVVFSRVVVSVMYIYKWSYGEKDGSDGDVLILACFKMIVNYH